MNRYRYLPLPLLLVATLLTSSLQMAAQDTTWFTDVTAQAHLIGARAGQISAMDINNDGYPDLLLQNLAYNRSMKTRFWLNQQDPSSVDPRDRVFVDVTDSTGMYANPDPTAFGRIADVSALADVNNDGHPDLVTGLFYYYVATFQDSGDRAEVLLNDGTGRFHLVPNNGLHELPKFPCTGFSFLDYDLDGNIDIYASTFSADHQNNIWIPGVLLKGNGDGTFRDVTAEAGIDAVSEPDYGGTVTDWNNDGWPDILTCPYCRTEGTLWKNNGDGTFTDATVESGYTAKNGMTGNVDPGIGARELCQWEALPADYDNDGDMDVAQMLVHGGLAADEGRSPLTINSGPSLGYHLGWDINKFERPLISKIKTWRDTLKSSTGADSIVVHRTPLGTGHLGDQAGSWLDFDNDMLQDFIISTTGYDPAQDRAYIEHQNPDHSFTEIAKSLGFSNWMRPVHTNRPFDYDLDGDDDFAIAFVPLVQYVPPEDRARAGQIWLVRNEVGTRNNRITVRLKAPAGVNADAIGARIYVYSGGVRQMRDIQSGVGRWGMVQPFELIFGLANNGRVDSIVVRWPGRNVPMTTVIDPPINQMITIGGNGLITAAETAANETGISISLFPNPASDWLTAKLSGANRARTATMEVYDSRGEIVRLASVVASEYVRVPIDNLPAGIYRVRICGSDGTFAASSFVKVL